MDYFDSVFEDLSNNISPALFFDVKGKNLKGGGNQSLLVSNVAKSAWYS